MKLSVAIRAVATAIFVSILYSDPMGPWWAAIIALTVMINTPEDL